MARALLRSCTRTLRWLFSGLPPRLLPVNDNLTVRALIAVIFSSVLMLPAGRLTVLTSVRPSRRGMAIGAAAATGRASVANSRRMARMGQPSEWNQRSEERRVGQECVMQCRYRLTPYN